MATRASSPCLQEPHISPHTPHTDTPNAILTPISPKFDPPAPPLTPHPLYLPHTHPTCPIAVSCPPHWTPKPQISLFRPTSALHAPYPLHPPPKIKQFCPFRLPSAAPRPHWRSPAATSQHRRSPLVRAATQSPFPSPPPTWRRMRLHPTWRPERHRPPSSQAPPLVS